MPTASWKVRRRDSWAFSPHSALSKRFCWRSSMMGNKAQQAALVAVFLPSGQATRLVKAAEALKITVSSVKATKKKWCTIAHGSQTKESNQGFKSHYSWWGPAGKTRVSWRCRRRMSCLYTCLNILSLEKNTQKYNLVLLRKNNHPKPFFGFQSLSYSQWNDRSNTSCKAQSDITVYEEVLESWQARYHAAARTKIPHFRDSQYKYLCRRDTTRSNTSDRSVVWSKRVRTRTDDVAVWETRWLERRYKDRPYGAV